jgi:hypothetical protein
MCLNVLQQQSSGVTKYFRRLPEIRCEFYKMQMIMMIMVFCTFDIAMLFRKFFVLMGAAVKTILGCECAVHPRHQNRLFINYANQWLSRFTLN